MSNILLFDKRRAKAPALVDSQGKPSAEERRDIDAGNSAAIPPNSGLLVSRQRDVTDIPDWVNNGG